MYTSFSVETAKNQIETIKDFNKTWQQISRNGLIAISESLNAYLEITHAEQPNWGIFNECNELRNRVMFKIYEKIQEAENNMCLVKSQLNQYFSELQVLLKEISFQNDNTKFFNKYYDYFKQVNHAFELDLEMKIKIINDFNEKTESNKLSLYTTAWNTSPYLEPVDSIISRLENDLELYQAALRKKR
eukprot:gb/GECH01006466.1/.p1 GENE.gb/GECH01006466.1/~~gb/GECH01006466.1/.p1  ORF type:complete len:188 (+),score=47.57 gb/GECH01006466.1/:1-564(+)